MKYIIGMVLGSLLMLAVLGAYLFYFLKNSKDKKKLKEIGRTAEEAINTDIKIWAQHTHNRFIPSSLIKYGTNMFFEVDSILITDKAVIVIEIKSIKGIIEGDGLSPSWNKIMGDNKFRIVNPIIQNDNHINHIVKMFGRKFPIISLVIFSNRSSLLKINNIPSHAIVIRHIELFDTLDSMNAKLPVVFNNDDIKSIESTIRKNITKNSEDIKKFNKIISQRS